MRSQNIKYNSPGKVGGASCLALLLLTFLTINPISSLSAYADETDEASTPATQADTPSTIGISFAPAAGSTSLSPTTATGQSAQINVLATVNVQNSGGYSVYLKSDTQNLVGKNNSANVIPGISGSSTYANLSTNTWGYYAGEGSSVPEGATYKAVSVSGNGDRIAENGNSKIKTDTKNIMLSFAAKINDEMPADTYQNTVTLSVVSSPLQTTLTDITNMQDMTSAICKASAMYETKQLKDVRDGKFYWVTKLADNNCWMTQNLDLDIPAGGFPDESVATDNMTWQNSDMTAAWTNPTAATATTVNSLTVSSTATDSRSWDQGMFVYINPKSTTSCTSSSNANMNSSTDCDQYFQKVDTSWTVSTDPDFTSKNDSEAVNTASETYDAHYLVGNWYQYNAATAGSGDINTSSAQSAAGAWNAPSSICPKGWRLPTSARTAQYFTVNEDGSFGKLLSYYGWTGTASVSGQGSVQADALTASPLFFVRSGYVDANGYLNYSGEIARYWSSTAATSANGAFTLTFRAGSNVYPSDTNFRNLGFPVRCLVDV